MDGRHGPPSRYVRRAPPPRRCGRAPDRDGQTSAAYLLPKYVERFRKRWPEVGIEIRTGTGKQRLGWLRTYELDLVVGSVDVAPTDVDFRPVLASELVLITAAVMRSRGASRSAWRRRRPTPLSGTGRRATSAQVAEIMLRLRGVAPEVVVDRRLERHHELRGGGGGDLVGPRSPGRGGAVPSGIDSDPRRGRGNGRGHERDAGARAVDKESPPSHRCKDPY